jgi:KDO2-lipid IV(A) lauroyltransferase
MYRAGIAVVRRMPRAFNRLWVRGIADWNYWIRKEERRRVEANLGPVIGEGRELRQAVRRLFRNYAELLVDYAAFFGAPEPGPEVERAFVRAEGYEHLERARARGRGVVLVTAHVGFWELGGVYFRRKGIPLAVLTLEDPDPGVHNEKQRLRAKMGIETITVGGNPWGSLAVARALRENSVAAMLVDRYDGADAVSVELFGRKTLFAPGPTLYARMTGAAVVPAFVVRSGPGRYRGLVLPPVSMEFTKDRDADLARNTQRIARVMEGVIRAYPDQWYNFDRIWRE